MANQNQEKLNLAARFENVAEDDRARLVAQELIIAVMTADRSLASQEWLEKSANRALIDSNSDVRTKAREAVTAILYSKPRLGDNALNIAENANRTASNTDQKISVLELVNVIGWTTAKDKPKIARKARALANGLLTNDPDGRVKDVARRTVNNIDAVCPSDNRLELLGWGIAAVALLGTGAVALALAKKDIPEDDRNVIKNEAGVVAYKILEGPLEIAPDKAPIKLPQGSRVTWTVVQDAATNEVLTRYQAIPQGGKYVPKPVDPHFHSVKDFDAPLSTSELIIACVPKEGIKSRTDYQFDTPNNYHQISGECRGLGHTFAYVPQKQGVTTTCLVNYGTRKVTPSRDISISNCAIDGVPVVQWSIEKVPLPYAAVSYALRGRQNPPAAATPK